MVKFKDQEDALLFIQYLYEIRQLQERTVKHYLYYYSKFDPDQWESDEYLNKFIIKHKNCSVVRGMVKNYCDMKSKEYVPPKIARGNKEKKLIRKITPQEIEIMRTGLYAEQFQKGMIFDLLLEGALRRVEIISIKIGSFKWEELMEDPEKMCRLVVLGKGNKERMVLIDPKTAEKLLNKLLPDGVQSWDQVKQLGASKRLLFAQKNGSPLNEQNVYDVIRRGSIRLLGRDIRPHEIRHHRSTELQKRGIVIDDIKNYLGHSRIATTEIYLHKSGEESIETIEANLLKK